MEEKPENNKSEYFIYTLQKDLNESNEKEYFFTSNFRFKLIIILLIIFVFIGSIKFQREIFNRVCMCAIAKEENKYIKEFVDHYKNYDIDKIYIFDNNNIGGERFEDVIQDYIDSGFVELVNYRGVTQPQMPAYNDCYRKYNKFYDWLIYFDIDEFIYLKDFKSFKTFLNDKRFDKCNRVQFNFIFYTDNNQLYYEDKPLKERFTEREPSARGKKRGGDQPIKSALRGNMRDVKIYCPHVLDRNTRSCDGFGNRRRLYLHMMHNSDYEYYYLIHYAWKSTEEFIQNKLIRSDVFYKVDINMKKIAIYFEYNQITKEKIDLIESRTKYNLTKYRNMI